ncbi:MAG: class I SAM-dependent methyltransferase [Jatrophihabitans sp.]|uniref:class I SAM-dependent methyltransferase n=1 Tax=Jatrophihabitans sp. TaxID=1932789 RepID=UPI003F7D49D4
MVDARVSAQLEPVRASLDRLGRNLRALEIRQRRDVFYAAEVAAVATTAEFVHRELRHARHFGHPHETLRYALGQVSVDGLMLEFGVASGTTLRIIADALPGREIVGFDVFTGLPEDWRPGFAAGAFAQDVLPEVPGATLVPGLFAETLPSFLETHPGPVAFLHLDADLYSSTAFVLDRLRHRLVAGTVIVFDEYFNYPGWHGDGEHRAWQEFVERTGAGFEYLAYTHDNEQVVVRVTGNAAVDEEATTASAP